MNDAALALSTFAYGPQTLAAALGAPLVLMLACASARLRRFGPAYLVVAPLFALAACVLASDSGPLVLDQMIYPIVLVLDPPGALLLGVTSLLWLAAGIFAASSMRDETESGAFVAFWLATLVGNIGVFMAADVASFYLFFALVSLPAYGLIVAQARMADSAGGLYVSVALLGEAFLILAFALLASATPDHSLLISDGVDALPASPWRDATIGLLIAGFGTKIGLLPLHVWMPSTYRAAPVAAAAVLSGGAVNAGVIGLVRFFPWGHAVPVWGEALVVLGMSAAFYGVAIGLTQRNPKTMLAYSSISQMGLVAATLGAGLVAGNKGAAAGAALYAAHHGLAKGGLFLAVGVLSGCGTLRMRRLTPFVGLLALSLAGLPFSGGVIAKLAIKQPLGDGLLGALSTLSAIATTLLMLHFLRRVAALAEPRVSNPGWALITPMFAMIAASIMAPTAYYFAIENHRLVSLDAALFWESLWPILVGALIAAAARRWLERLPALPEGDVGAFAARPFGLFARGGAAADRGEIILRRWPVAAGALMVVAIMISGMGVLKP
ncbi:MAG: NADH/ubiquinone/plastoquinone (complex I) [Methylocystis sp.]|nr:MAG: NADH/ubiquinone/plastoquinone (complex I) [Methylocystis sp.]